MNPEDSLRSEDLRGGLRTRVLGGTIHYFPECTSTNTRARELAGQGAPDGTLVVTDLQTAGRGRLDRTWVAPAGKGLLFSLILRPPIPPERFGQITMAAGLGCVAGIAHITGVGPRLKWPNDITIGGRKAGGLLSEFSMQNDRLEYLIVGAGINVNFDPRSMDGIPADATSLQVVVGRPIPRAPLLRVILEDMEPFYLACCEGRSLRGEWKTALETVGAAVRVTTHSGAVEGVAEDVEESGALVLRLADGTRQTVLAGDVVELRPG